MPSISEIIDISSVSQYLATAYIKKGGLHGKGLDLNLPRKLYCIRKNVEYRYEQEDIGGGSTPSAALVNVSNKLYSLCFAVNEAISIVNGGTGGGTVTPTAPVGNIYPFVITSSDFESDGVTYINANMKSDRIMLFINQYSQQWLVQGAGFFDRAATGFEITIPGFDATTQDYTIIVEKLYDSGVTPTPSPYPYIFDSSFDETFN
jgi:hypothetical protein